MKNPKTWEFPGKITRTISLSFLSEASEERGNILSREKGSHGTVFFFEVNFLDLFPRNFGFIINKHFSTEFSVLNM